MLQHDLEKTRGKKRENVKTSWTPDYIPHTLCFDTQHKRISPISGGEKIQCLSGATALQNKDHFAEHWDCWEPILMRSPVVINQRFIVMAAASVSAAVSRGWHCGLASLLGLALLAPLLSLATTPFSRLSAGGVQSSEGWDETEGPEGRDPPLGASCCLLARLPRRRRGGRCDAAGATWSAEDTLSVVVHIHDMTVWLSCVFYAHSTQNRSFQRRFPKPILAWYGKN